MTLEGYVTNPCMCILLAVFWHQKEVATRKNGYYGLHFKATWGTTQGRLISPNLFNLIVDDVVRSWPEMTAEDQIVVYEGL